MNEKKVNIFGILGFVIGILSIYLSLYYCIASVVGLIFSIVGMIRIKKTRLKGFAIAGLVINILTLVVWGLIWYIIFSIVHALQNMSCQPVVG